MNVPAIPSDVRERIVAAAQSLYEQAGRESFPTVDQVRRVARVDMNAASAVMREWRRQQTVQAAPVAVTIPEGVQVAHSQALAALWLQAQELANESLRTAQTAWETERAELDAMRQEMAAAYESQATELEAAQESAMQMQHAVEAASESHRKDVDALRAELTAATTRAERAEARVAEIEKRADGLQGELTRAHQDADQVRAELESVRRDSATEIERLRSELASVRVKAEAAEDAHQAQRKTAATELTATTARAERAEARVAEIEKRADGLQVELTRAGQGADQMRSELDAVRKDSAAEIERLRSALAGVRAKAEAAEEAHQAQRKAAATEAHRAAEMLTKAQSERDTARQRAGEAREAAAKLAGQLEAVQAQNVALLATLKPAKK